jgi:predicted GTPase
MKINPSVRIIDSASPITVENPQIIKSKNVLVVEDGPTLTHGGMKYGAGTIAANKAGAHQIIDPRPYTVGTITETFNKYPGIGPLLPAMGYSDQQIHDLEQTINRTKCDAVIIGTPIDLTRIIDINKPVTRVRYEIREIGELSLVQVIDEFLTRVST